MRHVITNTHLGRAALAPHPQRVLAARVEDALVALERDGERAVDLGGAAERLAGPFGRHAGLADREAAAVRRVW